MPRAPITSRTLLFEKLADGTLHQLDVCLVQTSLGQMVELRSILRPFGDIKDEDFVDSSYTQSVVMQSSDLFSKTNFGGCQWPHYRTNDPSSS